jgi:hypothetical protein
MRLENVHTIGEALVNFNLVPVSSFISERAEALTLSHLRFGPRSGRIRSRLSK